MILTSDSSEVASCGTSVRPETPAPKAAAVIRKVRRVGAQSEGNIINSIWMKSWKRERRRWYHIFLGLRIARARGLAPLRHPSESTTAQQKERRSELQ